MLAKALIGAALIAAVSTIGDFVWAELHLRHRVAYGLTHGALLFLSIGAYLGSLVRQSVKGAAGGALIGLAAAGGFYLLAPIAGYSIMFVVWAFVWAALAWLTGRALQAHTARESWRRVASRGALAAIGSGVAFYLISGIWRPFDPRGWDYAVHYISWTLAYLPGFAALTSRNEKRRMKNE